MGRAWYVGRRLLQAGVALLAVSLLSFLMLRLTPGDPARVIAGPRAPADTIARIRTQLGLDEPLWTQYARYLSRVVRGDLGQNLTGSATVGQVISQGIGVTAALVATSAALTIMVCVPLALIAARRPDGIIDTFVRVFSVGGLALPSFWVGVMLVSYVALTTGLLPVGGWSTTVPGQLQALVLPTVTLTISTAPIVIRSLRSSLIEVMSADYVKAAYAMGVRGSTLTRRFVLRNAAVPTVPIVATVIGFLIGSTVIVEATFNLPGLGLSLIQAASTRDTNVVQGLTLVYGGAVVLIYLAADLSTSVLDPRVRLT